MNIATREGSGKKRRKPLRNFYNYRKIIAMILDFSREKSAVFIKILGSVVFCRLHTKFFYLCLFKLNIIL